MARVVGLVGLQKTKQAAIQPHSLSRPTSPTFRAHLKARQLVGEKYDRLHGLESPAEVIDLLIDYVLSEPPMGQDLFSQVEWKVLKTLVFERELQGQGVMSLKEYVFEEVLPAHNAYARRYNCLVFLFRPDYPHRAGEEQVEPLGVIYQTPGNTTSEALRNARVCAEENRVVLGEEFQNDWIGDAEVDGFDTCRPRPAVEDLVNGVATDSEVLRKGFGIEC